MIHLKAPIAKNAQVTSEQAFQSISVTAEKWLPLRGVQSSEVEQCYHQPANCVWTFAGSQVEVEGRTFESSKKWLHIAGRRTDAHQCAVRSALDLAGKHSIELSRHTITNHQSQESSCVDFLCFLSFLVGSRWKFSENTVILLGAIPVLSCRFWLVVPLLELNAEWDLFVKVQKRRALMQSCYHCLMLVWRSHNRANCDPWMPNTQDL